MIDISEVLNLLDDTKLFIESLRKKESFEFKPVKKGALQNSKKEGNPVDSVSIYIQTNYCMILRLNRYLFLRVLLYSGLNMLI